MAIVIDASLGQFIGLDTNPLNHNADYTFMVWVYATTTTDTSLWISGDLSSPTSVDYILTDGTSVLTLIVQTDDITGDIQTGSTLATNTWTHIAITRSGNTCTVYVNGVSDIVSTQDITGRSAVISNQHYNNGRSGYVKTWSKALTAAQVASEMNAVRPLEADSVYSWLPTFAGEHLKDYSGNGRDWTESEALPDGDPPPVSWGASPFLIVATSADTNLTAALFTDSDTLYTAALTSSYDLTASLHSDGDTLYTAALTSSYDLTAALHSDGDTLYTAALTSSYDLTAALHTDADTTPTAALTSSYDLTAALHTDADTTYTAALTSEYALTAALFTDGDTTPTAALTSSYDLTASHHSDSDTLYTAALTSSYDLTAALHTDSDTLYTSALSGDLTLTAALHSDGDTLYTASISLTVTEVAERDFFDVLYVDTYYTMTENVFYNVGYPDTYYTMPKNDTYFDRQYSDGNGAP